MLLEIPLDTERKDQDADGGEDEVKHLRVPVLLQRQALRSRQGRKGLRHEPRDKIHEQHAQRRIDHIALIDPGQVVRITQRVEKVHKMVGVRAVPEEAELDGLAPRQDREFKRHEHRGGGKNQKQPHQRRGIIPQNMGFPVFHHQVSSPFRLAARRLKPWFSLSFQAYVRLRSAYPPAYPARSSRK